MQVGERSRELEQAKAGRERQDQQERDAIAIDRGRPGCGPTDGLITSGSLMSYVLGDREDDTHEVGATANIAHFLGPCSTLPPSTSARRRRDAFDSGGPRRQAIDVFLTYLQNQGRLLICG